MERTSNLQNQTCDKNLSGWINGFIGVVIFSASLPATKVAVLAPLAWLLAPSSFTGISAPAWAGLAYISVFSMLIGFVFWYRGLAQGGIAAVGQLQLLQPFFGLALAATLLHETVSMGMLGVTAAVIVCVIAARKFAH